MRTAGLYQACYDTNLRSHERLQAVIISAVRERRRHIGSSRTLSDSVELLHEQSSRTNVSSLKTRRSALHPGQEQNF